MFCRDSESFALFLFSTDPRLIQTATQSGVGGVVVDWESIGKAERQAGFDTQINHDTVEDLARVRAATRARVLCRLNAFGPTTQAEIEAAIDNGADELLLPMVRSANEVETVLAWVNGRCDLGILIETEAAVERSGELARLPISRVYVGLHDLAIERKTANPFQAIADGTVERLRAAFEVPFGFAGLTLPDRGFPIPCRLLMAEMARLRCDFTFLRRSFHRDTFNLDLRYAIARIRRAMREAFARSTAELEVEHRRLLEAIAAADGYFRARCEMNRTDAVQAASQ